MLSSIMKIIETYHTNTLERCQQYIIDHFYNSIIEWYYPDRKWTGVKNDE
jgi:hypothetical protein